MATYKVQIVTGDVPLANTVNSVAITLVGTQGESSQEWLNLGIRKITVSLGSSLCWGLEGAGVEGATGMGK